jgi:hypothetical protein
MQDQKPANVEYVKQLVLDDLLECDEEQIATFRKFAVEPYSAPIARYGIPETVVVVARNGNEVIYYEDVEEGFNVSPVGPDGTILEHWCNQDELKFALDYWIEGRIHSEKCGPAQSIE